MTPARKPGSLALRLFLSAMAVTIVVLVLMGLVLAAVYRSSAERAFDRRLDIYLKAIVAEVAGFSGAGMPEVPDLSEPLFSYPLSGWYWQVVRLGPGAPSASPSRSLSGGRLPILMNQGVPVGRFGVREAYVPGPDGQMLRIVERELDLGAEGHFAIAVAADAAELEGEVGRFLRALIGIFAVLAFAFVLILTFQVRFGLGPLKRVSGALAEVRSGKAERLEGAYPEEVAPLVQEVNALIDANREIVERARTHVGNLAHALKTPLSILLNEAGTRGDPLAARVRDQAGVMRDQVTHHLERARMAARISVVSAVCDVTPVITSLARTMEKIHRDRDLGIEVRIVEDVRFRGERQDLEEMVGNLVDNACKWAASRVEVEVCIARGRHPTDRMYFHVIIDDDGPGLAPARRAEVGRRGRRLDESKPGSGLGLSIVHELAAIYGGRFELGTAPIGGLRTELVLPAA